MNSLTNSLNDSLTCQPTQHLLTTHDFGDKVKVQIVSYDEVAIEVMKSVIDLISYNICPIPCLGVVCNDHDISIYVGEFFLLFFNFIFAIFTTTMQYPSVPWQLQHRSVE